MKIENDTCIGNSALNHVYYFPLHLHMPGCLMQIYKITVKVLMLWTWYESTWYVYIKKMLFMCTEKYPQSPQDMIGKETKKNIEQTTGENTDCKAISREKNFGTLKVPLK